MTKNTETSTRTADKIGIFVLLGDFFSIVANLVKSFLK